jgi:hypothetical protein
MVSSTSVFFKMRNLLKFSKGTYLIDSKRKDLGIVYSESLDSELKIQWSTGIKQTIALNPSGKKEQQLYKACVRNFKRVRAADFNIPLGRNQGRILKVLVAEDHTDLVIQIIHVEHLLEKEIGEMLCQFLELPEGSLAEVQCKKENAFLRVLFRVFH